MQRIRRHPVFHLVVLVGFLGACRTYVPIEGPQPEPGTKVRAELSDQGAANLASQVGPRAVAVDGHVASAGGPELVLAVSAVQRRDGLEEFWRGEQVTIPRADIASLRRERISPQRTGVVVGTAVALAFLLYNGVGGWEGLGGGKGGRTPTPQ